MNNTFLVTGASGFIGQELVKYLKMQGCKVNVLLRTPILGDWDEVFFGDLASGDIPKEAFDGVDGVFHLAGLAHAVINDSKDVADFYQRVNVCGTEALLKIAEQKGVGRFLYMSSVKAGGESNIDCLSEVSKCLPIDVYGKTKREAEQLVLDAGMKKGGHVCNIRPSLVYGEKVKGNISRMLSAINEGKFPPLPEFNNSRSMVSIDDLVKACWLAMNDERANQQTYIVTDAVEYSTRKIYLAMCEALGKTVPEWVVPAWGLQIGAVAGDCIEGLTSKPMPLNSEKLRKLASSACYSSNKIQRELGWSPQKTLYDLLPSMVNEIKKG